MTLFYSPEEHAANGPDTWLVVRVPLTTAWAVETAAGITLDYANTKAEAEALRHTGWLVTLYHRESRWFAGERVRGWRQYAEM